jgi:hypothetical protein
VWLNMMAAGAVPGSKGELSLYYVGRPRA